MEMTDITSTLKDMPRTPGVYTWRAHDGTPLYIGKATNLRSRLSSYRRSDDRRIRTMIGRAAAITWEQTATDIEALITESNLIKKYQPRFNVMLRDDKQYFYVAVTDEPFPRLVITHQDRNKDIKKPVAQLIGPFTEGWPLKKTLAFLRKLFPYCTCKQPHTRLCLNAHLGLCRGYCCLKGEPVTDQVADYRHTIIAIRDVLSGRSRVVAKHLRWQMKDAASRGDLERAAGLKRTLESLDRVFTTARVNVKLRNTFAQGAQELAHALGLAKTPRRIEGYDIANIMGLFATGSMIVFTAGSPDTDEYRKFNIRSVHGSNDIAMLREVLSRRLTHREWRTPQLIIVDGGKAQLNAMTEVLQRHSKDILVIALTKGAGHRGTHLTLPDRTLPLSDLPENARNLVLAIDAEAHRFAIRQYRGMHERTLRPDILKKRG